MSLSNNDRILVSFGQYDLLVSYALLLGYISWLSNLYLNTFLAYYFFHKETTFNNTITILMNEMSII